jgi:glycosyltransferase involved in cell wall biosynthesis
MTVNTSNSRTPLHVMLISTEYPPETLGGLGSHVSDLTNGLAGAGCRVTVLAYTGKEPATEQDGSVTVHRIPEPEAQRERKATMVEHILGINEEFRAYAERLIAAEGAPPDVIHCHDWFGFPAARALRAAHGVPVVGTVHLLNYPFRRWWGHVTEDELIEQERAFCRDTDAVIGVSHSMREIIMSTHDVPGDRVSAIHNGVDLRAAEEDALDESAAQELRRKYAAPGEKIVLFAGRFTPQKGMSALLESAAAVIAQCRTVRYLFAGAPDSWPATQMMERLYSRHTGLRRNVTLLGKIPRRELAALYHIADLAVVPSIYEPFGYAAIEAMIAGVPVVASNVGGLAEIIEPGLTGLLVSVRGRGDGPRAVDVRELTAATLELLGDDARRREMGARGRARVQAEFTLDKMTEATLQVYRRVSAGREVS